VKPLILVVAATVSLSACGDLARRADEESRRIEEASRAAAADARRADEAAAIAIGEGYAFGRVQYSRNGQNVPVGALVVHSVGSDETRGFGIGSDGGFRWPLRPGEHVIVAYVFGDRGRFMGRVMASFSLPRAGTAVYVGDLRIDAREGESRIQVVDQYDEALKRREAPLQAEPVKGLMHPERTAGSYKRRTGICSGWGIVCDGDYRGVRPLQPEETLRGFPITQGLQPRLEWAPVVRPGITYDVAIFESLRDGRAPARRYTGALVAYAQGLGEPAYSPPTPLAPGKRYEWTVRLREGDTVSTWSSTLTAWSIIVVSLSESGFGFGFETPAK